jgi:hypothetical protein
MFAAATVEHLWAELVAHNLQNYFQSLFQNQVLYQSSTGITDPRKMKLTGAAWILP